MRIFVTGGTGFVGSHTVAELVRSGHEVRLLVRNPDRISPAFAPLGIGEQDYALGDVTDAASVEKGMEGCDAVLHAASIYSLDVRAAKQMRHVNTAGTETVLGAAEKMQLDPIVYVSSLAALYPPDGEVLTAESPIKDPPGAYNKSKAEAEQIARRYQERGVPVVTSYPGGVFGPQDPHFGENAQAVASILKHRIPLGPKGGLSVVDVRDLATAHAAMFEPGRGARRYMLSGTSTPFASIIRTLEEVTERRLPHLTLPGWALRPMARAAGLLQRVLPYRLPLSNEGFDAITWDPHGDDSRARAELGFAPRPVHETIADTVAWMHQAGRITAKQAGKLSRRSAA
jgi:dihydroflavonol-4-reductase